MASCEDDISMFQQITGVNSDEIARFYLKAKNWRLDEAVNMFFVRCENGFSEEPKPTGWDDDIAPDQGQHPAGHCADNSSNSLPVESEKEARESNERDKSEPQTSGSTLASLYRQPSSLMFKGSFEKAKEQASNRNKWLIVNLQSDEEFNSHLLNRDTWSDEYVEETIRTNFIFWQVYIDKENSQKEQCQKVCNYYRVTSLPSVLIIDPITGQKMREWNGMLHPDDLLECLSLYMGKSPKESLFPCKKQSGVSMETSKASETDNMSEDQDSPKVAAYKSEHDMEDTAEEQDLEDTILSAAAETDSKPMYLPLPEEPKGSKELICRVGIRLPDGRRLQRNFLRSDPVSFLWTFCCNQMEESDKMKPFVLAQAVPGTSYKSLVAGMNLTFEEAELSNSLLSLVWL